MKTCDLYADTAFPVIKLTLYLPTYKRAMGIEFQQ